MNKETLHKAVRDRYGERAKKNGPCCPEVSSCCGPQKSASQTIGYTTDQLKSIPEGADLGLGCGNPTALASLKQGETVLDLGSGAGIDCFLAAQAVGPNGCAIGVDMTPEMVDRARENARKHGIENTEFRLGEIEHLPVADNSVDVVISNCVINLSPDKTQVFREAYRVLKPGGRLLISDIVLLKKLPPAIRESIEAYVGCIAGASMKADYLTAIKAIGFRDLEILNEVAADSAFSESSELRILVDGEEPKLPSPGLSHEQGQQVAGMLSSITVRAIKPIRGRTEGGRHSAEEISSRTSGI